MSNDQILVRIRNNKEMKCQGKDKGGDTSPVTELDVVLVKPKFHLRFYPLHGKCTPPDSEKADTLNGMSQK